MSKLIGYCPSCGALLYAPYDPDQPNGGRECKCDACGERWISQVHNGSVDFTPAVASSESVYTGGSNDGYSDDN